VVVKAKTKDLESELHDLNSTSVMERSRYIIKTEEKHVKILPGLRTLNR